MAAVTISKVIDLITAEILAFEIVANDGRVYFVTNDPSWEGMRCNPFPNESDGTPHGRVEIARLE